ncbi:metal ABC transporter permease [Armatimonas rosea]|uniref:ABC-type Mn2+/Zn2+ transport system permease subunit n=1 Tax=Armatimonas rosea TaxID=685828 RepID=A0A7W9W4V5_ARMRO|nr:metal ABC transporter permease [Armatimonas rosea]MBB6048948.1 ABC-type Mn2+/Zn2+ transport system permease subunit [Armatimonas rosea]
MPVCVRAQAPPPPPPEATAPETTSATPAPMAATMTTDTPAAEHDEALPEELKHASVAKVFGLDFMQRALVAGVAVGLIGAYLGVFVVLRRVVFVGMALAQFSSAGVALGLLLGLAPLLGSIGMMLVGVFLLSLRWSPRKVRQDTVIGLGYVLASAVTILLLAKNPRGETQLLDLLSGNIITVTQADTLLTIGALAVVFVLHRLFAKELLFVSFDPDTAQAAGYNTRLWETLLTLSIGIAIAFSIHAVGILLTFGTLVIPAVSALLLTKRISHTFTLAAVLGAIPIPLGLYLSFIWDFSPGAMIVALSAVLLVVCGLLSKVRS